MKSSLVVWPVVIAVGAVFLAGGAIVALPLLFQIVAWSSVAHEMEQQEQEDRAQERAEIRARPRYEAEQENYRQMLIEMQTAIKKRVPNLQWPETSPHLAELSACATMSDLPEARSGTFDLGVAQGAIPEKIWPKVTQDLTKIAAHHSLTAIGQPQASEQPDEAEASDPQELILYDEGTDAKIWLGSAENTKLWGKTACLVSDDPQPENPNYGYDTLTDFQLLRTAGEAEQDQLAMINEIRAVLQEAQPDIRWRRAPQLLDRSPCTAAAKVDGAVTTAVDGGSAEGAVSAEDWPEVAAQISQIAADHGYGVSYHDQPDRTYSLERWDAGLGKLEVSGTDDATWIDLTGQCRMP